MTNPKAKTKPTIYLAGKVNGTKWKLVEGNEDKAEFIASDGYKHSEHQWGYGLYEFSSPDLKEVVAQHSLAQISQCDLLVAYLDCPSSYGSIAEIAYASALGKECLLIICYEQNEEDHTHPLHDAYWFVSCLPGVRTGVVETFERAQASFNLILRLATEKHIADILNSIHESPLEQSFFAALISAAGDEGLGWDDSPYLMQKHNGVPFTVKPQYEVRLQRNYRLDFFIEAPGVKLGVEIDGHDFHERTKEQARRDKERDRALVAAGFTVLRFTGSEIYNDVDKVVSEVLDYVAKHYQPLADTQDEK